MDETSVPILTRLKIRPAESADVSAITGIYNDAVLNTTATFDIEPRTIDDRQKWLSHRDIRHPVLVADLDGRVVAWASLAPWSARAAYEATAETAIYVDSESRHQGIGRCLLTALIDQARGHGFRSLIAQVTIESEVSAHLHRSAGFEHVGTLIGVGEKFGRILDVLILQKRLRDHEP
jgi:phosphinothricin acetyltransferase